MAGFDFGSPWQHRQPSTPLGAQRLNEREAMIAAKFDEIDATSQAVETKVRGVAPPTGVVATDRAAIQAELDAGAGVVKLAPGGYTYEVDSVGSQTFTSAGGTLTYCLEIPAGVTLDLNGSHLKLTAGANAVLICNAAPGATTDTHVGLIGAKHGSTIIGTGNTLTGKGLVRFEGVTDLALDVNVAGSDETGVMVLNCTRARGDIEVASVTGIGAYLGSPTYPNSDCEFGRIFARSVTPNVANAVNFPGNSVYYCLSGSHIDSIIAKSCTGGVKCDTSTDTHVDSVVGDLCGNASANSGFKFQSATAGFPLRCTVGTIHMRTQQAEGLYFDPNQIGCSVGEYVGHGNAILGTSADARLDGSAPRVGRLRTTNSGGGGVSLRPTALRHRIDECEVTNAGQVTGNASASSFGLQRSASSEGTIGHLRIIDDQGTKTMNRGLDTPGSGILHVGKFECWATSDATFNRISGLSAGDVVQHPRLDATADTYGEASPAGAATTTVITNGNFRYASGFLQPQVEITPLNASARALAVNPTFAAGSMTLNHAAAAGTEKYRWRLVAQVFNTTAMS